MPTTSQIEVSKLILDLKNFRTVPQKKESNAIKAMISIKPDRFFAVMDSIIEDGYLLTENIIVLNDGTDNIVKEGNRRIAALKLIHGYFKLDDFGLPSSIISSINKIDTAWKAENLMVPCTVFSINEVDKVDRVVALAHGKGEKASRDPWNSVARARHNRDVKGANEYALDLLEKYLKKGMNLNNQQKDRWGGEYPLTVLEEALRKSFARMGFANVGELVAKYPHNKFLQALENILLDIGLEQVKFETIRNAQLDFPSNYGIPPIVIPPQTPNNPPSPNVSTNANTANTTSGQANPNNSNTPPTQSANNTVNNNAAAASSVTAPVPPSAPKAVAINDPRHVVNLLNKFAPRGANRQKVVTLRDELRKLKIKDNPIAFCFLLRSMFEISAKAYSTDHSLSITKSGGGNKSLAEVLKGIAAHLTNNNSNLAMVQILHGASTEITKPEGILSVTSMNQLVHSPSFSVAPSDICILFSNIYPLLEAMN
ncbi:MAG: hypothetical protein M1445_01125 [Bacteroidetes bacterium]|nr:hypothetical protein [Bacteroidota bacterium]MCL6103684.1 hypothetical protein [Bacteroidota bacterium]